MKYWVQNYDTENNKKNLKDRLLYHNHGFNSRIRWIDSTNPTGPIGGDGSV